MKKYVLLVVIGALLVSCSIAVSSLVVEASEPLPEGTKKFDFTSSDSTAEYEQYIKDNESDYSEEELSGEASRLDAVQINEPDPITISGNVIVNANEGYITFKANVDEEIHETCFVQFMNMHNYKEYAYYLYEVNEYTSSMALPYGDYVITGGGIPDDYKNEYPIKSIEFTVKKGVASLVEINIGKNDNMSKEKLTINLDEQEKAEIKTEESKASKWGNIKSILINLVVYGIVGGVGFFVYMKYKKRK